MRNKITFALAALTFPTLLLAQTAPAPRADAPPPPPSQQRGMRGGEDMLVGVQHAMKATDEEWKVIAPQLRKVISARRTVESAGAQQMGFPMPGRGGPGGGPRRQDSFNGPGGGPRGPGGPGGPPGAAGETRPAPGADRPNADSPPPPEGSQGPGARSAARRPDGPPNGPGGFRPRGGGGGGPPGIANNPVMLAISDLQTAIADEKTSPEQLKEKVAAVRAAREKAKKALADAESELRDMITPPQEAVLVGEGFLD